MVTILLSCISCIEQEVTELRNKVNKLEDENKRLSQLIHQNKVSLPSTWSDSSLITTAMRATSSPRNSTYPQCRPSIGSNVNEASRSFHSTPTATIMSTVTNCLSVTSILSSHSKEQVTTTNSRQRNDERQITTLPVNDDSQALTLTSKRPLNAVAKTSSGAKSTNRISNNTSRQSNPLAITRRSSSAAVPSTSTHLASLIPKATEVSRVTPSNTIGQASFMPQSQTAMILSVASMTGMEHLPHQQTDTAETSSVDKAFSQAQQMRSIGSNSVQGSISQLPYSIDALTGNHNTHNRQQATTTGNPLNFSAESLIGRQETSSDIALVNNPVNQPVIQNTFTLTHRNSLINGNSTPTTAAPQSFSNFSALSLVGNTDTFSVNASSSTRSSNTGQDSGAIPPSTGNIFTDFSTESLIGQTEFTSDFAIDNLISRSDSNAHMATINPNLIQSFGKGSDPMISSVSGDHANHLAHNFDPPGFNIGTFTSHLFPPYW